MTIIDYSSVQQFPKTWIIPSKLKIIQKNLLFSSHPNFLNFKMHKKSKNFKHCIIQTTSNPKYHTSFPQNWVLKSLPPKKKP